MKNIFFTLLFLAIFQPGFTQHNIIPTPVDYKSINGQFTLDNTINIDFDARDKNVEQYIQLFSQFLTAKGLDVSYNLKNNDKNIRIILNSEQDSQLGKEGYTLEVNSNDIRLTANQPAGVFNGLQTLKLLFPAGSLNGTAANPILLQACKITDYPRFGWRGLMLDVSRHFFTVDEVKAFIDQMAAYKFNVFHWHLTDDQGWRIEIKSLPKLTEIGAWRVKRYGRFGTSRPDPEEGEAVSYGGYYTQDQIRDIVKYAQERNITIVPEIDMPGHSMAALAAYPELSVNKEPKYVSPGNKFSEWYGDGTFKMLVENTLNPTDEKVYDFVDKVFTEVAQLFPGTYIHMGGDEAYHGYWEQDPEVQKFMKKHKIKTSHELQSYFVKRVEKIINSKGKKMIGWDEILEGGLAENAAVMSWRGMQGGVEAAKLGHEVVMSPTTYTYIDYMQGDPSVENYIYSSLSLEKTYQFEPVPEGVDPKYILGGQGNLWTEEIPTMQFAFYMTYPRAFAIAESVWSPKEKKNWDDFERRVENHFQRFDAAEINISKAVYDPIIKVYYEDDKLMCSLENNIPGTDIRYTINNTYPVKFGITYSGPFEIPQGDLSLRTQTFRNGKPIGRQLQISSVELEKRARK